MMPKQDDELLQILDAEFARASRIAGEHLVCRKGCTACCYGPFAINALDAMRLREGMAAMPAELAERVRARARKWVEEFGGEFPGVDGVLGESDEERARFEEFANDAACPALDVETGLCDVYEARPMTCRVFGPPVSVDAGVEEKALGHCELCFTQASAEVVEMCQMHPPHELEASVMAELGESGETVVAFALL
jgi:Fe-S-cluster containining protein